MTSPKALSESWLIFLMGLIQFINVVDFVMVMPLGPDFASALGIPTAHIGYVGGIYTFAAALFGFVGAFYLDNFRRKNVLLVSFAGLIAATALAALAQNMLHLMVARFIAGMFGGTVSAITVAIVSDHVPPQRRGSAIGKLMGAFSVASVIGIPFGLEIASRFDWRAPFLSVAAAGVLVWGFSFFKVPHDNRPANTASIRVQAEQILTLLKLPTAVVALLFMGLSMMSGFLLIPNFSAYIQLNLGYPRAQLGWLYFAGGLISFFGMRFAGKLVDKTSATLVSVIFSVLLIISTYIGFASYHLSVPVMVFFVLFMLSMTGRNIAGQTLSSEVPPPQNRAAYMSLQSAIMHLSGAIGAFISSIILVEQDGKLVGIPTLAYMTIGLCLIIPFLYFYVEKNLKKKT